MTSARCLCSYEASLDPWLLSLWTAMANIVGRPYTLHTLGYQNLALDRPKYSIIIFKTSSEVSTRKTRDLEESKRAGCMLDSADAMYDFKKPIDLSGNGPRNPYLARMVERLKSPIWILHDFPSMPKCPRETKTTEYLKVHNKRLTRDFSERDVRHIEFDLGSSGLTYKPGDALAVMPSQSEDLVDAFMKRCCLDPDSLVLVQAACKPNNFGQRDSNIEKPITIKTLVQSVMDIASASPRRYFFEVMSHFATAEHEKEKLTYFVSPEGREDLYQYNQRERRTVLEVLEDFPSVQLPLEWLLQLVPRLQPRLFSISSSLLMHPNRVHITVAVQKWQTPLKRIRQGLCSTWLSSLEPQKDDIYVPIWCKVGLKFPDASVPLLLVGPGTGCAPFRALIEERVAMSASSSVAPIMFFFGCRQEQDDFLYKDFWLAQAEDSGVLSTKKGGGFFAAFSRDQLKKVYVQHKIEEQSKKVWAMLCSGCVVYVAGSAVKMPADVFAALEKVVRTEGCQSEDAARKWLKQLERVGRYHVEAW
ncbi:hypothetical protein L7F22_008020 [Adiantum nelumboides]|nr:hypothetical protein [Adiantum nelumboides]